MKGPPPKDPKVRQRKNASPSRTTLPPELSESTVLRLPAMPAKNGGWTKEATKAWERMWRAPMAARYLKADFFRIEILIDMVDRYWRGEVALAAQIRLEGDSFATSPLARRRLEWEIRDHAEEPEKAAAAGGSKPAKPGPDLRKLLRGDFAK